MINDEDVQLIANASLCRSFRDSEMYKLLDSMMKALEEEALNNLSAARTGNKEELFGLTVRWQERKFMRQAIMEEIDSVVADGHGLIQELGVDPNEIEVRSMLNG